MPAIKDALVRTQQGFRSMPIASHAVAEINYIRGRTGMSKSEIAKALGITRMSINFWERGICIPSTGVYLAIRDWADLLRKDAF